MKFQTSLDAKTFLAEVKEFSKLSEAGKDYKPTKDEVTSFIKARNPLVKKLKNSKRSSAQKTNWRRNRSSMMKGIMAFHKSTDGKRFHRRLGRFLSTRLLRKKDKKTTTTEALLIKQEFLKGFNAAKQHLFVEMEYFHQLEEQVDLELFITDHALPLFRGLELKVLSEEEINEDEIAFILDIIKKEVFINCIAESMGREFAESLKLWKSIVVELKKNNVTKFSENYYTNLIEKFLKGMTDVRKIK